MVKRKTLFTVILIALFALGIFGVCYCARAAAESGVGTAEDPHIISTPEQLKTFADEISSGTVDGYNGEYFVLSNDIDMSGICAASPEGWDPVGDYLSRFKGHFDGRGFAVKNLDIVRPDENYVGLFGILDEAATVVGLSVYGDIVGKNNTGGIAGQNFGRIENCFNHARIHNDTAEMAMNVGGITGLNGGAVVGCGNFGDIDGALYFVGGVVGINDAVVEGCFGAAEVSSSLKYGGGVAGMNSDGAIVSESFNSGAVDVDTYSGGVVGGNDGTVACVYNTAAVMSTDHAGGICGTNGGVLSNAYNRTETISGRVHKGAICGRNVGSVELCYNSATLYPDSVDCVGVDDFDLSMPDVISAGGKLGGLAEGVGAGKWIKREFDDGNWYMPELAMLGNSTCEVAASASRQSAAAARITVAAADVAIDNDRFIYSGEEHKPDVLLGGSIAAENVIYTRKTTDGIDAGGENGASVEITFINYYKGIFTFAFTVAKREISLDWSDAALVYNGCVQTSTARAVGAVDGENIEFEYETSGGINAGRHTARAVIADERDANNYSIKNAETEYTILCSDLFIVAAADTVYNGKAQKPTVEIISGQIGDEHIVFDIDGWQDNIDAGEYTVAIRLEGNAVNANYFLRADKLRYAIDRRSVEIEWAGRQTVFNGRACHPEAFVSDSADGDEITLRYSGHENNVHVGTGYTVSAELEENAIGKNYTAERSVCVYDITPAPIFLTFSDAPLIYNGKPQYPQFTASGLCGGDAEFIVSGYENNIAATVGEDHTVTVRLRDGSDYAFEPVTVRYGIEPMPIVVKWKDGALVYNGAVLRPDAEVVTDTPDKVELVYSGYDGRDAGSGYRIEISSANGNYIVANTLTYDIAPRPVEVVLSAERFVYNGKEQKPEVVSITGVLPGDTVGCVLHCPQSVRSGEYVAEVELTDGNYTVGNAVCRYVIGKKQMIIDGVTVADKTFDGSTSVVPTGGRVTGAIAGDDVDFVFGECNAVSADAGVRDVHIAILLIGKDASCYEPVAPLASVLIKKAVFAPVATMFPSVTFAYDGAPRSVFYLGELPVGLSVEYVGNGMTEIGEHTVTARFADEKGNYEPIADLRAVMFIAQSVFADGDSGVEVRVVDGYIDYGAVLRVEKTERPSAALPAADKPVWVYDISFEKGNVRVLPNGRIEISVETADIDKYDALRLYRFDGSEYSSVKFEIQDGAIVFFADSLSVFVLTGKKSSPTPLIIGTCMLCLTAAAAIVGIVFGRRARIAAVGARSAAVGVSASACGDETSFVIDGVQCTSIESFECALCFKQRDKQIKVCAMPPEKAADYARGMGKDKRRVLYWNGAEFGRRSEAHERLAERAREAAKKKACFFENL